MCECFSRLVCQVFEEQLVLCLDEEDEDLNTFNSGSHAYIQGIILFSTNILRTTTVLNIDDKKCLNSKSAY